MAYEENLGGLPASTAVVEVLHSMLTVYCRHQRCVCYAEPWPGEIPDRGGGAEQGAPLGGTVHTVSITHA